MACTCTSSTKPPSRLNGSVELLLLKDGHVVVARQEAPCQAPPRGRQTFAADALLDGFHDSTYAYRFGPPEHEVAIATLFDDQHQVVSEAFYFVKPTEPAFLPAVQFEIEAESVGDGSYQVALCCDHFLQSVSLNAKGFLPDDNYFHLVPSRRKLVLFTAIDAPAARFRATLEALNLQNPLEIRL